MSLAVKKDQDLAGDLRQPQEGSAGDDSSKSLKTPLLRYRTSSEGCLFLAQQTCQGEDSLPVTIPGMVGGGGH